MATQRITVRIPEALATRIHQASRGKGRTPSELIRLAVESYLEQKSAPGSAYEAAKSAGLIGCASKGPRDLSTNTRHFEGFGKNR